MCQNQDKHSSPCMQHRTKMRKNQRVNPFCPWQKAVMYQKSTLAEVIQSLFHKPKLSANGGLLLRFHNSVAVGRGLHALQPLAQMAVSAHTFRTVAHVRVCDTVVLLYSFRQEF